MNPFRVWVRPLGGSCRVRVAGTGNAQWLLTQLSHSFVFKSSQAIAEDVASACSTFVILYSSQVSRKTFEKLLGTIPEVQLMPEPA